MKANQRQNLHQFAKFMGRIFVKTQACSVDGALVHIRFVQGAILYMYLFLKWKEL